MTFFWLKKAIDPFSLILIYRQWTFWDPFGALWINDEPDMFGSSRSKKGNILDSFHVINVFSATFPFKQVTGAFQVLMNEMRG